MARRRFALGRLTDQPARVARCDDNTSSRSAQYVFAVSDAARSASFMWTKLATLFGFPFAMNPTTTIVPSATVTGSSSATWPCARDVRALEPGY